MAKKSNKGAESDANICDAAVGFLRVDTGGIGHLSAGNEKATRNFRLLIVSSFYS